MFLVDSSIWINHFRKNNQHLFEALNEDRVVTHPFIIGEIALGSLKKRRSVIDTFHGLQSVKPASDTEVLQMIENHSLYSKGIGYIDAHLLASALIEGDIYLWTADNRLKDIANQLGVAAAF